MNKQMEYPALYVSASQSTQQGQQRFVWATRVRLTALTAAAVGGAAAWNVGEVDLFGWLALVAFISALAAESYILAVKPEKLWYEGRAAAESAKTLAWRYVAGGDPFPMSVEMADADRILLRRLDDILTDLEYVSAASLDSSVEQIPPKMRELRSSPFDQRKEQYLRGRIIDQEDWYSGKAAHNEGRAHLFTWLTIVLEFSGILGAVLKAFTVVSVDLLGVVGAGAAGLTAWAQARQYSSNGRAYSIAFHELASIRSEIEYVDEKEWARYVEEAEEAISREHTLWRASKGVPPVGVRRRSRPGV